FHREFANAFLSGAGHAEAWRLQSLTDLTQLPDYEEGNLFWRGRGQSVPGAPVDADGKPVFHRIPRSYETATSDGERRRWMLAQTVEFAPARRNEIDMLFAGFLREQFGVQTMATFGRWFGG